MAKRKGKSQQRPRHWDRLHREGDVASEDAESRRRLTQRRVRLPGQQQDAPIYADTEADAASGGPRTGGTVIHLYPGGARVRTADYGDLLAGVAGTFRPAPGSSALAVGDRVALTLTPEAQGLLQAGQKHLDSDRVDALILQREPRETALSRPQPMRGKRRTQHEPEVFEKVIAANMDQLVVVAAVRRPAFSRRLLDRYLIVAERGELPVALIHNKVDLGDPDHDMLAEYAVLGVISTFCSATTGEGLDGVRALLAGKASILAGASGVGKSSLLNALIPGLDLATREVRLRDDRGRHVTSAAVLYELPGGGTVVDTPGIRELGIEIRSAELPWYFPEIAALAPECKFRNCTHTHEPDCAVLRALAEDRLASRRYHSYLRILESLGT